MHRTGHAADLVTDVELHHVLAGPAATVRHAAGDVEPGTITVMVGASSDDIRLTGRFEIVGEVCEVGRDVAFTTPVRVERGRVT